MLIDVKGWKSVGNKLSAHTVKSIKLLEPVKKETGTKEENGNKDDLEVGSTIDLNVKKDDDDDDKDQLGLFKNGK